MKENQLLIRNKVQKPFENLFKNNQTIFWHLKTILTHGYLNEISRPSKSERFTYEDYILIVIDL